MAEVFEIFARTIVSVVAIIILVRIVGLRSFSKMSSFDFGLTVAMGSLLAGAINTPGKPLFIGIVSLIALFSVQFAVSFLRTRTGWAERIVDNNPILLMTNGEMLDDNLSKVRVTQADVIAKLREANALDLGEVHAVVLETTGDISVLHGTGSTKESLDFLLDGVERKV